jgi:hypothetical protein
MWVRERPYYPLHGPLWWVLCQLRVWHHQPFTFQFSEVGKVYGAWPINCIPQSKSVMAQPTRPFPSPCPQVKSRQIPDQQAIVLELKNGWVTCGHVQLFWLPTTLIWCSETCLCSPFCAVKEGLFTFCSTKPITLPPPLPLPFPPPPTHTHIHRQDSRLMGWKARECTGAPCMSSGTWL